MADAAAEVVPRRSPQRWLSSLRFRLALAIVITVASTGVGAGWVALRLARQSLTDDVRGITSRATVLAVAAVERLPATASRDDIVAVLRDIEAQSPEIETISVIADDGASGRLVATTGVAPSTEGLALAQQAMREGRAVPRDDPDVIRVAAPVSLASTARAAVLVRANLEGAIGLQQRAFDAILRFGLAGIIGLVLIVDLLAWRLVYRPIQNLRATMERVAGGELSARADVMRSDELGDVAQGLNDMLARLENFNDALQARVREATSELQQRNAQLVESYNRVFGLREQLASAEQLASVGQTAANVAHQVGTPLNLISGYVQILKEEIGAGSPLASRLAIIDEQVAKVTETVRTLLDRSRQIGRKTRTTAGQLVEHVTEAMRPSLDAAGITLEMEMPAAETPILVDTTNFEMAILNLMTNAVDAMPGGGILRIRLAQPSPGRVQIEVTDTGHGIPRDLMPRIFEAWVSTKKPGRGTGLGLPIARDVISAHGGTISVASEVGKGTTFTIELPADQGRELPTSAA